MNGLLENLSDEEQDIFTQVLQQTRQKKIDLSQSKQIREIVPIEKWLNSPYYVGRDGAKLYDFWKEEMVDIFGDNRGKYSEVIVTGSLGCLNENTRVPTTLGNLTLKELDERFKNGERFKVLSEDGLNEVYGVKDNGYTDTVKIVTKQGRIVEGTPNHRFRVVVDGEVVWKRFDELKENDKLVMTREKTPFGDVSEDMDIAYTLGYITGDGWTSINSTKRDRDKNMLGVMFLKGSNVGDRLREGMNKLCGYYNEDIAKKENSVMKMLRANNEELVSQLLVEGLGDGAKEKDIIDRVYSWNKRSMSEYIKGLFDADGTVGKSNIAITMASKDIIYNLADLLSMYGINYYIKEKTMNTNEFRAWRLSVVNRRSWMIFRDEIGFDIDYKKDKLDKLCEFRGYTNVRMIVPDSNKVLNDMMDENKIKGYTKNRSLFSWYRTDQRVTLETVKRINKIYPNWIGNSEYLKYILEHDVFFDEVDSVEESKSYTRDLAVKDSPTYSLKGFISHNTGKSTFALFCMLRKLYELSCYENIAGLFDLMSTSFIVFIYFSVNRTQAELTGFGQFRELVDSIDYFQKEFGRNEKLNSLLKFPENVLFTHGSSTEHAIGMNMIGAILDEANFFKGEERSPSKSTANTYSKIAELYSSIVNRGKSRFMDKNEDHSLSILVSSATHSSSFTQKRIEKAVDDPHTKIIDSKLWEVKPEKYSDETFWVFAGSEMLDPFIVKDVTDVNKFLESIEEDLINPEYNTVDFAVSKVPAHYQEHFVEVPVDFRKSFRNDLISALQDIAGVSIAPMGRLFTSRPTLNAACQRGMQKGLKHPFYKDEFVIPTNSDIKMKDFLRDDFVFKNRDKPRYIHIDQSTTTDSTGMGMVHVDRVEEIDGVKKTFLNVDFIVRINPPKPPKEISIGKIRDFVFYMRDEMDINIKKVSYDWFGSSESRQVLNEEGIEAEHQSVDRNDEAYLTLVRLLFEERIDMYKYEPFTNELFDLIHDRSKRKVDHPPGGKKDASDGLAGAVIGALEDDSSESAGSQDGDVIAEINRNQDDVEDMFNGMFDDLMAGF